MLGIGSLALLAAGCTTNRVQTDYNRQISVSAWHTYAWMAGAGHGARRAYGVRQSNQPDPRARGD
jgi:hypothetical protein